MLTAAPALPTEVVARAQQSTGYRSVQRELPRLEREVEIARICTELGERGFLVGQLAL